MKNNFRLSVPDTESGQRIDSYLAEQIPGLTRSTVQNLLAEQAVTIAGKAVKKNYKLSGGEDILVQLPEVREVDLSPEDIPLDIVYEDADLISGQQTARAWWCIPLPETESGTLVKRTACSIAGPACRRINGVTAARRIVHRIDKDTSGLLVGGQKTTPHIKASRHRLRRIPRFVGTKQSSSDPLNWTAGPSISRLHAIKPIAKKWL